MRGKLYGIKRILRSFVSRKHVVWQGPSRTQRVALTFDDGPHPQYTGEVLTILRAAGVKATFFLLGENMERHPDLSRKIAQNGHVIGGHLFRHEDIKTMSLKEFTEELNLCRAVIKDITGKQMKYFRPPHGRIGLPALHYCIAQGLTTVLWSIDSRDFEHKSVQHVIDNVLGDKVKGGDIILFHDNNLFTLEALPAIIQHLKDKGFSFVTVDELV